MTDVTGGDWTPDDRQLIPVQGGSPRYRSNRPRRAFLLTWRGRFCASDCPTQVGQETPSRKGRWLWQPPTHRRNSGRTPQPPSNGPTTPQGHSERGADPRHRTRHPAGQSPPASQRQAEPVRRRPVQSSVHRLTGQPSSAPHHYRWGARLRWSAENRCGRYVVGRAMGVPGVTSCLCPY